MSKKAPAEQQQQQHQQQRQQPQRRKVTLACMVCRKKKVKCNGVQPSCARCQSMGLPCQYSDPPKKRGPPKGCVEIINSRARRIESLLSNSGVYRPMLLANNTHDHHNQQQFPFSASYDQQPNEILKLVADAALQIKAGNAPEVEHQPDSHSPFHTFYQNEDDGVHHVWIDSFFTYFNVLFPVLSRPHFLHQLVHDRVVMHPLLKASVYCLGSHYLDPQDRTSRMWFAQAQSILVSLDMMSSTPVPSSSHHHHQDGSTLSLVQSLVIMCWYAFLTSDLQQCHSLRQHLAHALCAVDPNKGSTVDQELCRRVIWVSYVINQWLYVCTGERIVFSDHIDCPIPKLEDCQLYAIDCRKLLPVSTHLQSFDYHREAASDDISVESAFQVAVFSEMVKLANIVQRATFHTVSKAVLTEWLLNLPPYLDVSSNSTSNRPSPIARIFHMLYHSVLILLNQNNGDRHVCHTSANTLMHLADQMIACEELKYLYNVFNLSLTLAATAHLHLARMTEATDRSGVDLSRSLRILKLANPIGVSIDDSLYLLGQQQNYPQPVSIVHQEQQQQQQPSLYMNECTTNDYTNLVPFATTATIGAKRLLSTVEHVDSPPIQQIRPGKRACVYDLSRWLAPEQEQVSEESKEQQQQPPPAHPSSLFVDDFFWTATALTTPSPSDSSISSSSQQPSPSSSSFYMFHPHSSPSLSPQIDTTPSPTASCFSPPLLTPVDPSVAHAAFVKQQEHANIFLDDFYIHATATTASNPMIPYSHFH